MKVFYNVTVKVDLSVNEVFIKWMKEEHVPAVMATGMFLESRITKVLGVDESDGITYSFQYIAKDMATFQQYQSQYARALQMDTKEKFGEKALAFRSLMEIQAEF